MGGRTISLELVGLPEDGGHPTVESLSGLLDQIKASIRRLGTITDAGKTLRMRVVEVSYASPLKMKLELFSRDKPAGNLDFLLENFENTLEAIRSDEDLPEYSFPAFDSVSALARVGAKGFANAQLTVGLHTFQIDEDLVRQIEEIEKKITRYAGIFDGFLEQINIHNQINTFAIFPISGPKKINCKFRQSDIDTVVAALGRRVEIEGTFFYRPKAPFPHLAEVDRIRLINNSIDFSLFDRLQGVAPLATGSKSSADFIREIRDAW
jgi:hypothetical protein